MTTASFAVRGARWERLARLRDLIDLLADLRDVNDPLGSADDFIHLADIVARFAELLGVDPVMLEGWMLALADKEVIEAIQAVARLLLRLRGER